MPKPDSTTATSATRSTCSSSSMARGVISLSCSHAGRRLKRDGPADSGAKKRPARGLFRSGKGGGADRRRIEIGRTMLDDRNVIRRETKPFALLEARDERAGQAVRHDLHVRTVADDQNALVAMERLRPGFEELRILACEAVEQGGVVHERRVDHVLAGDLRLAADP